jgi:hypothetical protein
MLCSFTEGVEVSSFLKLARGPRPPSNLTEDDNKDHLATAPSIFFPDVFIEVIRSGAWHDHYPGERRIKLDYTRIISFYDTSLAPSLVDLRFGRERWDHRLNGISETDIANAMARLEDYILNSPQGSGVDWDVVIKTVAERYIERLELLEYIVDVELSAESTAFSSNNATDRLQRAHDVLFSMIAPYVLSSVDIPPPKSEAGTDSTSGNISWAEPIFEQCAIAHTKYISSPSLVQRMTPSESMLLHATQTTSKEICRVITRLWAQGIIEGVQEPSPSSHNKDETSRIHDADILLEQWSQQVKGLMAWLDWSVWIKCKPACSFEV